MKQQVARQDKIMVGEALSQFIQTSDFPADIKDCAGKYTENNWHAAIVSGLEPADRIGMDVYDIGKINHMPPDTIEKIVQADRNVTPDKAPISLVHTFLDTTTGFIVVDTVFKKPVVNLQGKMVGVLSYARDTVPYIDRAYLYLLYKRYYPVEEAMQIFLQHMQVASFLITALTDDRELLILLHSQYSTEQLSQKFKLPASEIYAYQAKVRDKLAMIDYEEFVQKLCIPGTLCSIDSEASEVTS
jgi:hypothetical protein